MFFGIASTLLPRDASFDVVHYHLHNGWSALEGRDGTDLAPAEMHSFLNPGWQIFVWLLIDMLPGRLVAFILGGLQALLLPVLYALTRRLLVRLGAAPTLMLCFSIALAGFSAEAQYGLFASVRNDALSALVFLAALTLLIPEHREGPDLKALALASAMVGAIIGLKLTNGVYGVGFAVAAIIAMPNWRARLPGMATCAVAGGTALVLFGGPWAWMLYQTFGNPVFPQLNGLFDAPLGPDYAFRDERYLPGGVTEAILRPFLFLFDGSLINEHDFFDPRLQIGYIASVAFLIYAAAARPARSRPLVALTAAALATLLIWSQMFSIARYVAALWLMGPVILAAGVAALRPSVLGHKAASYLTLALCAGLMAMTQPSELRRAPWSSLTERYVDATIPKKPYGDAIIVYAGGYPGAFLAPYFPESVRHTHLVPQDWSAPALANYRQGIRTALRSTAGPVYAVIVDTEGHLSETEVRLQQMEGMAINKAACEAIATNFASSEARWLLCPLRFIDTD